MLKNKAFILVALAITANNFISFAQKGYEPAPDSPIGVHAKQGEDKYVRTPNYDLASRFSTKRVGRMVFSTRIKPNWFRDSDKFWYEWKTSRGSRYYIVDAANGKKSEIFDMSRIAMQLSDTIRDPFDARHIHLINLKLKDDKAFTFDIRSSIDIKDKKDSTKTVKKVFHFEYDIASRKLKQIKEKEKIYPDWAAVSPDGTIGLFLKNHNLFYMDSTNLHKAAKDEKDSTIVWHRLTGDGIKEFSWGTDNYKGSTTADTTKREYPLGVVWSPDSKHFATMKWDMRPVKNMWVINSVGKPRPTLETYKYQMPGEPGPKGELYVFSMPDGTSKKIAINAFKDQDIMLLSADTKQKDAYKDYYSNLWLGDENNFWLYRLSRDLKRVDLCRVGIGEDSTHTVIKERLNTYVEFRKPKILDNGNIIFWSERNGWANLYLFDKDGRMIKNLTEGAFHVEDVLAVNSTSIIFSACGVQDNENPYQIHTYGVPLSGGKPKKLDMDDMDVLSYVSDDGKYFIANYSRVDCKPAVALFSTAGKKISDLEEADFSLLFEAGYKFPERFKVKAADGVTDLYGAMYKPFDFDSTKIYPVCDYVYPGPQVEANNISWSKGFTRTDRLAQLGFIVVTVGNRGGHPNRSKWYHNYGYGNLRDYGLEDQKYALQQLGARYSFMDMNRVGIHGHSGGGFMSTAALLTYPDFFKVAVSCSGNHDNTIYNRWWSEQHHGILEKIDKGDTSFVYKIKTNQELVKNLKGHLMLWTGDIDDNVHPANTIRVMDALIKANKRFDVMFLPGQRHGYGNMNDYFFWRMADYYCEWLMGESRRGEVDIKEMNND